MANCFKKIKNLNPRINIYKWVLKLAEENFKKHKNECPVSWTNFEDILEITLN